MCDAQDQVEECKCGEEHHKIQYGIGGVYTYCTKCNKTVGFWEDPEWKEEKKDKL